MCCCCVMRDGDRWGRRTEEMSRPSRIYFLSFIHTAHQLLQINSTPYVYMTQPRPQPWLVPGSPAAPLPDRWLVQAPPALSYRVYRINNHIFQESDTRSIVHYSTSNRPSFIISPPLPPFRLLSDDTSGCGHTYTYTPRYFRHCPVIPSLHLLPILSPSPVQP